MYFLARQSGTHTILLPKAAHDCLAGCSQKPFFTEPPDRVECLTFIIAKPTYFLLFITHLALPLPLWGCFPSKLLHY